MTQLTLPPTLTHNEAKDCLQAFLRVLGEGSQPLMGPVHINARPLTQFDSSALAVLLELKRRLLELGEELVIEEPTEALLSLVKVYGVADFLMSPSH